MKIDMLRIRYFYFVLLLMLSQGCEEPMQWNYINCNEKYFVVDGIITDEYRHHEIRLYWSTARPDEIPSPIENATVYIEKTEGIIPFIEHDSIAGLYLSIVPFKPFVGENVHLHVQYKSHTYFATDKMAPVTVSPRIEFEQIATDTNLFVVLPKTLASIEPAMWEIRVEWDTQVFSHGIGQAKIWAYDLKILNYLQVFAPTEEKVYVPRGANVFQFKYSLSNQHAQFRASLLQETHWREGIFNVTPGLVYTNIKGHKAAGYFGCCAVVRDTFTVK